MVLSLNRMTNKKDHAHLQWWARLYWIFDAVSAEKSALSLFDSMTFHEDNGLSTETLDRSEFAKFLRDDPVEIKNELKKRIINAVEKQREKTNLNNFIEHDVESVTIIGADEFPHLIHQCLGQAQRIHLFVYDDKSISFLKIYLGHPYESVVYSSAKSESQNLYNSQAMYFWKAKIQDEEDLHYFRKILHTLTESESIYNFRQFLWSKSIFTGKYALKLSKSDPVSTQYLTQVTLMDAENPLYKIEFTLKSPKEKFHLALKSIWDLMNPKIERELKHKGQNIFAHQKSFILSERFHILTNVIDMKGDGDHSVHLIEIKDLPEDGILNLRKWKDQEMIRLPSMGYSSGEKFLKEGDILITSKFSQNKCKYALVRDHIEKCFPSNNLIIIRPMKDDVRIAEYLLHVLNSPYGQQELHSNATLSNKMSVLSVRTLKNLMIPEPADLDHIIGIFRKADEIVQKAKEHADDIKKTTYNTLGLYKREP